MTIHHKADLTLADREADRQAARSLTAMADHALANGFPIKKAKVGEKTHPKPLRHPERERRLNRAEKVRSAEMTRTDGFAEINRYPSEAEIMAKRTAKAIQANVGAWDRKTLAEWGIPWPPPGGWKAHLITMHQEQEQHPMLWTETTEINRTKGP